MSLKIDIGCGPNKRAGFIGVDIAAAPGVDHVLDIQTERLPFDDDSVDYVFSNHAFEHIHHPQNILKEIVRVSRHGATVEIWTPYLKSNDAFVLGHYQFYNETIWKHICFEHDHFYFGDMRGRFELKKYHYVLYPGIVERLKSMSIPFDFALEHMFNIALEFGAFVEIDKSRTEAMRPQYPEVMVADTRAGPYTKMW